MMRRASEARIRRLASMKRKRGAKQDRLLEVILLLGAIFPIATFMFYLLNLFPLAIVTLCLTWVFSGFSIIILIAVAVDRIWAVIFDRKPKQKHIESVSGRFDLIDDGEIIEMGDDEKRKRGVESKGE
jgi:hypothetical protein